MKIKALVASSLIAASTLFGGTYAVDTAHSSADFSVKHMMISTVKGNFSTFSGNFEYDEASKQLKTLKGEIAAASIDTGIKDRDGHLRSADLFDVEKYPTIMFVLDEVKGDKAYGKLTLHGVTKPVVFAYDNGGVVKDPWGKQRVGVGLSGTINRSDFGITWNKALEAGGVVVSENVKIDVALEGILQK